MYDLTIIHKPVIILTPCAVLRMIQSDDGQILGGPGPSNNNPDEFSATGEVKGSDFRIRQVYKDGYELKWIGDIEGERHPPCLQAQIYYISAKFCVMAGSKIIGECLFLFKNRHKFLIFV